MLLLVASTVDMYAQINREDQLKAAWLYKFAKYIEWQEPYEDEEIFKIGVLTTDTELRENLKEWASFKRIGKRMVDIKIYSSETMTTANDLEYCDIFFISRTNKNIEQRIMDFIDKSNTLIVGETDGFAERGGSIGFYVQDNKLLFKINKDVLRQANYKIDPQLLRISTLTETKK